MCWFHPIHVFIHPCHMIIVLNDYLVCSCWGLHLGSRFSQTIGSWDPFSFALWIVVELLCSFIFVCLMQLLRYIVRMKRCSTTFLSEGQSGTYMWWMRLWFEIYIMYMQWRHSLHYIEIHESIFLAYMESLVSSRPHARHLRFQWSASTPRDHVFRFLVSQRPKLQSRKVIYKRISSG